MLLEKMNDFDYKLEVGSKKWQSLLKRLMDMGNTIIDSYGTTRKGGTREVKCVSFQFSYGDNIYRFEFPVKIKELNEGEKKDVYFIDSNRHIIETFNELEELLGSEPVVHKDIKDSVPEWMKDDTTETQEDWTMKSAVDYITQKIRSGEFWSRVEDITLKLQPINSNSMLAYDIPVGSVVIPKDLIMGNHKDEEKKETNEGEVLVTESASTGNTINGFVVEDSKVTESVTLVSPMTKEIDKILMDTGSPGNVGHISTLEDLEIFLGRRLTMEEVDQMYNAYKRLTQ